MQPLKRHARARARNMHSLWMSKSMLVACAHLFEPRAHALGSGLAKRREDLMACDVVAKGRQIAHEAMRKEILSKEIGLELHPQSPYRSSVPPSLLTKPGRAARGRTVNHERLSKRS